MPHAYAIALAAGVVIPLISFAILAFFGARIGKPKASYVATAAIGISCLLGTYVLIGWLGMTPDERVALGQQIKDSSSVWAHFGNIQIDWYVKLDSLTVIMYFMVTFIAFWIHFFSIGYMEGHSDEVAHESKYHRFFAYLSLFCFSMLGLVISSSLLFLFIFWELVGLCSYLLIGFYFDKKYASNAAMKAFITNRIGDFGFLIGLMIVVLTLGTFDLEEAAKEFANQYRNGGPLFDSPITMFGYGLASLMGIGLFCGAMGKSAQFPLHVWLPDAMAGPTPVSALIHAATMVAAGVYLVARIFRLLTPDAQMFIAVIGCITLTITALIAIVQTDIKKVLAYSTLSQLGYMIFGMGVGAWVGALFHLMTHAFFKAMLFLGSGQVIEGCHHEQDITKMGGLSKKMPWTGRTFLLGVLAIAGFGIPWTSIGLGGFFSKDEILAVAYERMRNWGAEEQEHADSAARGEHAAGTVPVRLVSDGPLAMMEEPTGAGGDHGHHDAHTYSAAKESTFNMQLPLPTILFILPLIIAYVTPFYMMRVYYLTFRGQPRDHHVYDHAHENWKMFLPLIVLGIGTIFCSYFLFRHLIHDAARVATDASAVVAVDGQAHNLDEAAGGVMMTLTHGENFWANPHKALGLLVGFSWVIGMGLAWVIYRNGLATATQIRASLAPIHTFLWEKMYFDHLYGALIIKGSIFATRGAYAFDALIVDGIANLSATVTKVLSLFAGRQLDMPVREHDIGLLDGLINAIAQAMKSFGNSIRQPQNGRIRTYIAVAASSAAVVLIGVIYSEQIGALLATVRSWFVDSQAVAAG